MKLTIKSHSIIRFSSSDSSFSIQEISKVVNPIIGDYRVVSYNSGLEGGLTQSDIDRILGGLGDPDDEKSLTKYEMEEILSCNTKQDIVTNESILHFEIEVNDFSELDLELMSLN